MSALVGQPLSRVDGPLKVTGKAQYAAEFAPDGLCYAALIEASIPVGFISALDTSIARRAPGVLLVLTHENAPSPSRVSGCMCCRATRSCFLDSRSEPS